MVDPLNEQEPDPVELPIDGTLDLHTFRPKEVKELLEVYIEECLDRKIYDLRIIHGKGTGSLRELVLAQLKKNPHVAHFALGTGAGGWGATQVRLKRDVL